MSTTLSTSQKSLTVDQPMRTYGADEVREDSQWQSIDNDLLDWFKPHAPLVDVGATPPSHDTIRIARARVLELRQLRAPPPDMVVPDNAGGIAFEWNSDAVFSLLSIGRDGKTKFSLFRDGQFVRSYNLG